MRAYDIISESRMHERNLLSIIVITKKEKERERFNLALFLAFIYKI